MQTEKNSADGKRVGSTDRLYVLAGNHEHARDFAYKRGCHSTRMVNIDSREKIMGLQGVKMYVIGTARNRHDYDELITEAKIREFEIEHI